MKKILIVCMYPFDSCPLFSYSFAKGLLNAGYDIYSILPANVENLNNWKCLVSDEHLCLLDNIRGEGGFVNTVKKIYNVVNFELKWKYYLKNIQDITFDYVFYMYFHRWNYLVKNHVNSMLNIMFVHDPIQHSGEAPKREQMHHNQVIKMNRVIVMSKSFIPIMEKEYGFSRENIFYLPICIIEHGISEKCQQKCEYDISFPIHFVFFGRISKYKGIDVLLKAYKDIENDNKGVSLSIIGAGDFSPYNKYIDGLKTVEVINRYIPDNEVDDFFLKCNTVVVVPYVDATQSGIIVLAYSHGNPVICSKLDGLVEQLDDGKLGLFFTAGNEQELRFQMQQYIDYPNILFEQSKNMNEYAKKLNWNVLVKQLMENLK